MIYKFNNQKMEELNKLRDKGYSETVDYWADLCADCSVKRYKSDMLHKLSIGFLVAGIALGAVSIFYEFRAKIKAD